MLPLFVQKELDAVFELSPIQIQFYQKNRFIKLKHVFSSEVVTFFNEAITTRVNLLSTETRTLDERDTYGRAFLQTFNLWLTDAIVKNLVFSRRLAKLATDLMQTEGVRLYHDQALFKENGGGITPWHADQYYWPLASDKTITLWMPLQQTPLEMGPLEFSAGSHQIVTGRELEISDNSENRIGEQLRVTNFPHVIEPFDLGEVSFHSGWVFHRAGANTSNSMRKVMTIIYMDKDMKLKNPENENQRNDMNQWCPGAIPDKVIDTPLNPLLYPS